MGATDEVAETEQNNNVDGGKDDEDESGGGVHEEKENEDQHENKDNQQSQLSVARLQSPSPAPPLQVVVSRDAPQATPLSVISSQATPLSVPFSTPQGSIGSRAASLNRTACTDGVTLMFFIVHLLVVLVAMSYFTMKAIQLAIRDGKHMVLLQYWVPQISVAAFAAFVFATVWQQCIRRWPGEMVRLILWSGCGINFVAGLLLICFSIPACAGAGFVLLFFSICQALYACWVNPRIEYAMRILRKAMETSSKFPQLSRPCYSILFIALVWACLWGLTVVGALSFYFPPLTIIGLILSLAWTMEVLRNIVVITVSRVISLFYLRGMQASVQFSFHRAITMTLGTACLGSLCVPTIEALRIIARALNLLEGEDEFMFSCAHCCYRVMEVIFRYGNNWAFVWVATYGRGFVSASRSCYELFQRNGMEPLLDSDITSSLCFLSGVSTGSLCVIICGSWTFSIRRDFTVTVSLISFFIGYLMTRISLALPQACVSAYYVCYAENPQSRFFDQTIPERMELIANGGDKTAVRLTAYSR
ncbi:uncharacterized protein LOC116248322 [Nymphaea colorata]|nr:uncharacterized protein LOC116248322 [Nymphaea colorata]